MKVPFQTDPYSVMAVSPVSPFWDAATVCFFSVKCRIQLKEPPNQHAYIQTNSVWVQSWKRVLASGYFLKNHDVIHCFKFKIFMFYQHEGPSTIPKITRNLLQPSPVMVAFRHETWIHQALQDGAQLCTVSCFMCPPSTVYKYQHNVILVYIWLYLFVFNANSWLISIIHYCYINQLS